MTLPCVDKKNVIMGDIPGKDYHKCRIKWSGRGLTVDGADRRTVSLHIHNSLTVCFIFTPNEQERYTNLGTFRVYAEYLTDWATYIITCMLS